MSDRRPQPPAAGGDDDPTPPRGTPVTGTGSRRFGQRGTDADGWEEWDDDEWDEPNYLVRRSLVVAVVVAAIAGGAILASRFIGGDDSSTPSTSTAAQWNTIVVLSPDEIRLLDRDSTDEIDTYTASDDLLDAQTLVAGNVLVTMTDEGRITQTDLGDGSERRSRSGLDETLRIAQDHPSIAVSGPDGGGDVTIIDTRDRSTLGVADTAGLDDPLIFATDVLVNAGGTHVAVPVPTAFQSVVIELETETSKALAGRVLALDDARVVTEQPAGSESELEFYDVTGERLGSVDVPSPQATLLRPDGTMLVVSADGTIITASADGSVDDVGTLTDPDGVPIEITGGTRVADGKRLIAVGGRRVFVLDADGRQLGVAVGTLSTVARSGAQCVTVGGTGSNAGAVVLDVETGAVAAEIERGLVSSTSYDGCTASFIGDGPRLVSDGEIIDVDADAIAAVAPDGRAYVALDGRDAEYVEIDDGDPVEIGERLAVIHFGQR
jgi:hypothetical protein